jgi:hypothetical protein
VVFRVLYNWLPLLVAGPLYVMFERRIRREAKPTPFPGDVLTESAGTAIVVANPDAD